MSLALKQDDLAPDIYEQLDYRSFLREWIKHQRGTERKLTLQQIAKAAKVSSGLLSDILSYKKNLTKETLNKISPHLGLQPTELSFLWLLIMLSDSTSQEEREWAYKKMVRFSSYRERHKETLKYHQYLSAWYYVTIREMSQLPGFKMDIEWVRRRLKYKVTPSEIKDCLNFLFKNGFIEVDANGKVLRKDQLVHCHEKVFRLAMAQGHREFLKLAIDSIYATQREYRQLTSYTVPISLSQFEEVRAIIKKAVADITEVTTNERAKSATDKEIFQISLMAFPLTEAGDTDETK